ncbi:pyridoxamine 5'-phosphate oxidase family protein [Aurantiacibacter marinus]|uniref:Flavin-binding protein n=1 Tax=Aurantiacibacter marinus TaxID=874156 RepID=A0A0H0XMI3_9SPHN|nr:pyridoxamine 5'-phosphate oxidase family protein [Aurantiacibacter marinus]KLI63172.1 flavin-binding protein [Aurantiacibacter marinus]
MTSFSDIAADITSRLSDGASNRRSAMHTAVVATTDAELRVMVLRGYDAATMTLRFHTDARSPKCAVVGDGSPVGVLFYDKQAKIQLRCKGTGRIERDTPAAGAAWDESTNFAKRCYLGEGPGALTFEPSSGLPEWIEGKEPTAQQVAPARVNFAVLLVELAQVDWFYLSNDGHRRAIIDMASGEGQWISP